MHVVKVPPNFNMVSCLKILVSTESKNKNEVRECNSMRLRICFSPKSMYDTIIVSNAFSEGGIAGGCSTAAKMPTGSTASGQ